MQRSHIASVYIYPSHFNCVGHGAVAVSVVPVATCMYCACEMQS